MGTARKSTLIIHVTQAAWQCTLVNMEVTQTISWQGRDYNPLPRFAGFYEYLRLSDGGAIAGVELHLSSPEYQRVLGSLPGFIRLEPAFGFPERWQFRFLEGPADINWEQILSENPYLGPDGDILLALDTGHLTEIEYEQLERFTRKMPASS